MVESRLVAAGIGAALAAALLCAQPGPAATTLAKKRHAARPALSLTQPGSLGAFTPASSNPGVASALARAGLDDGFRFTPSTTPGSRRAVTVAVRAQGTAGSAGGLRLATTTFSPAAYNLGVAVGWRRFALSGDYARVESGLLPDSGREAMDVGLSYLGRNWRTTLQLAGDHPTGAARLVESDRNYSVDLGGAYELTRNLAVTGGVRYQMRRDQLQSLADERRDSQAVYLGTAFKF